MPFWHRADFASKARISHFRLFPQFTKRRASPGYARDRGFGSSGFPKFFFDKLVMSRFHGQVAMSKRLPKTEHLLRQIAQPFSEDNSYVVI